MRYCMSTIIVVGKAYRRIFELTSRKSDEEEEVRGPGGR